MTLTDNSRSSRPQRLLLVGASTRAAAFSARRAGFEPICIDMFADADLRAVADVRLVRRYPNDVVEAAAAVDPEIPWLYAGGIENHSKIVAEISARRPLWGNGAACLRRVRNPAWVRDTLRRAGLPALDVIVPGRDDNVDPPPSNGRWLLKPLRSGGGRGICFWTDDTQDGFITRSVSEGVLTLDSPAPSLTLRVTSATASRQLLTLAGPHYFQRHIAGDSIGAVFLATSDHARLIGITRQLVGLAELDAAPFAYCGSIGPVRLGEAAERTIRRVGETLREAASLRGLFGCDFVFDGQTPWLVEVNPRYTASVEVLELATGVPLLEWHRRASSVFKGEQISETLAPHPQPLSPSGGEGGKTHHSPLSTHYSPLIGKAILYADRELTAPAWPVRVLAATPWSVPFLADIPPAGTVSPGGWPLCTVFARGLDVASVQARLLRRAGRVRSRFLESASAGG